MIFSIGISREFILTCHSHEKKIRELYVETTFYVKFKFTSQEIHIKTSRKFEMWQFAFVIKKNQMIKLSFIVCIYSRTIPSILCHNILSLDMKDK